METNFGILKNKKSPPPLSSIEVFRQSLAVKNVTLADISVLSVFLLLKLNGYVSCAHTSQQVATELEISLLEAWIGWSGILSTLKD